MSSGGQNYGWNIMEGKHCYNATTCNQTGLTLPVIEYGHTNGACSITGGYRYRGIRSARLSGMYIYGDYCNGVITGATQMPDGTWTTQQLNDAPFQISSFGEDVKGEMYVADYSGGRVLIIEDPLAPTISSITPDSGSSNGDQSVTIGGTNLSGATSVTFGGAAGVITANTSTSITVTTPPAPMLGTVDVVVTNSAGHATSQFRYDLGAPTTVSATAASDTSVTVSWTSVPGADGYEVSRSKDHTTFMPVATTNGTQIIDSATVAVNTAYLYRVRASAGSTFGPYSAVDLATTVMFTDDQLNAGAIIRAAHVAQLRTAVNAVRALAGFDPYNFTDPTLTAGTSQIRAVHIAELRSGLDEARSRIGLLPLSYTDAPIIPGATVIKRVHVTELRDGVR
jgi:hypothetical protein